MIGACGVFIDIIRDGICVSKMQEICWLLGAFGYINVKSECVFS